MSGEANQVLWRGVQPVSGIRGVWPAIDSVRISETASADGAATAVIYTVPANKVCYISTCILNARMSAEGPAAVHVRVRNVADTDVFWIQELIFQAVDQGVVSASFFPALEAAAGFDIYVRGTSADGWARGTIHGWLEDE